MFSAFFRAFNNRNSNVEVDVDVDVDVSSNSSAPTPTSREILEYSNRCMDTYRQIIDMNKQIAADIRQNTRLLINSMPKPAHIRRCPVNHELSLYTTTGGSCDVCNRIVFVGEQVMDCRQCNWYMCSRCARTNGLTIPQAPAQSLFSGLSNTTQSQLFTFDIPLNGQGFDDFISQLTQTLNDIVPASQEDVVVRPTEEQIEQACLVMPARETNLSEQYVCPIDLSPIEDDENVMKIKHCGHVFRESNLRELFTRDVKCPLCRFDVRDNAAGYDEEDD